MDTYNEISQQLSKQFTLRYSTSFGLASRLLPAKIQSDIYNIYAMVRVADEIVDTYRGEHAREALDGFETRIYEGIRDGYSADIVAHAFQLTARRYNIDKPLIAPFFTSMRADLSRQHHTRLSLREYIYGSAEVVGLMCLKVFCQGDIKLYEQTKRGAQALGAAYQKVNFLRDLGDDLNGLSRTYFPGITVATFTDTKRDELITDIEHDFLVARSSIDLLPATVRPSVKLSFSYYWVLLQKLKRSPADRILTTRVRVSDLRKVWLLISTYSIGRLS